MATSMCQKLFPLKKLACQSCCGHKIFVRTSMFDRFRRKKTKEIEEDGSHDTEKGKHVVTFQDRFQSLKKRSGIQTVQGYKPGPDVEQKIQTIADGMFDDVNDLSTVSLDDRLKKFKFLTKCQKEFDHNVTNMDLSSMNTVEDVVRYFKTEVKDTCAYEDISKLDLPKNLHMNLEYSNIQLQTELDDPEDEYYKEPIKDIKYSRKYKAHINKELEVLQH